MTISVASLFPEQFQIHQIQNGAEIEPKSNGNKSGNEFQNAAAGNSKMAPYWNRDGNKITIESNATRNWIHQSDTGR